jgi:xylono-1,5-lactonase
MCGEPVCMWPVGAELGEGPLWSPVDQATYFVDIKGCRLYRWRAGRGESWSTPAEPGFVAPCAGGSLLVGLRAGLYSFSPETRRWLRIVLVEKDQPGNRVNDGFVDPRGVLWFGTMDDGETAATGSLYSWRAGALRPEARDAGYIITNGPAVSPDGRTLYHTDTMKKTTYAFDLSEDGRLSGKRVFVTTEDGYPDGMAVDADGYVWIAVWDGWRIDRIDPSGRRERSVRFPCANVTKLAFGGPDLRTAYVTTARKGLSAQALASQPLAGGLFCFEVETPGLSPALLPL